MFFRALLIGSIVSIGSLYAQWGASAQAEAPQIRLNSFRLYEFDPEIKHSRPRHAFYPQKTQSEAATTVYAELDVQNLLHNVRDQEFTVIFKFLTADGHLLAEGGGPRFVNRDQARASFVGSWQWPRNWYEGLWPMGNYRVEAWINNTKIATQTFMMTDGRG